MKGMEFTFDTEIYIPVSVKVTGYHPPTPGTMYKSNGDPGDPPEGSEWDDIHVFIKDKDIANELPPNVLESIFEQIDDAAMDEMNDRYNDAMCDRYEAMRDR